MKNSNAITHKVYELDKPMQMQKMALILKQHIIKNNLYTPIMGKNYVQVEGWQFAGGMMGLFPRVVEVQNIAPGKWQAHVEIINAKNDKVMGSGFAICSKDEMKKKSFDDYAILSMAQTRAIGKAYRNLIGWVMKLTGYESTPAEEMKQDTQSKVQEEINQKNKKVEELKSMLKGNTDKEKIEDLKKRTSFLINDFSLTDKHAGLIIASLLNTEVKNEKRN